jgi:hypothetical protein
MTHPTLGYANLRFASDDAVHMPATPAATMTVACDAGNGPLSGEQPFPYDVDAAVTCPNCLRALESDWWMALMENERRTGEVTSLIGTLDDVRDATARLLSQGDAVIEETLLGAGASMIERYFRPIIDAPAELLGILSMQGDWAKTPIPPALAWATQAPQVQQAFREELAFRQAMTDAASPIFDLHADISSDYLFAQDAVTFRARQGDADTVTFWARQDDAKAYEHVQNPITPEDLDDVMGSLARQLADQRSPLVPTHEPKVARPGPFAGDVPLADPGAERVRRMVELSADGMSTSLTDSVHAAIDAAQQSLAEHPFDERCHRCNYDTHRCLGCGEPLPHGTEVCDPCNVRLAYEVEPETRPLHDCDADSCSGQTSDPPCGGCCRCLSGCVYDGPDEVEFTHGGEVVDRSEYDYPDRNWCHVHNREAQAGREQCSECDGEQGEDRRPVIDDIEFYGRAVDAAEMDHDSAVRKLVDASNGGLTEIGAANLITNWTTARSDYERSGFDPFSPPADHRSDIEELAPWEEKTWD